MQIGYNKKKIKMIKTQKNCTIYKNLTSNVYRREN